MQRWDGRVALVTGASSGIGAEICKTLVGYGINVIGCARREEEVEKLAADVANSKGKLYPTRCDLSQDSDINTMFEEIANNYGRIDICINNAGLNLVESTLLEGLTAEWTKMFEVNVLARCICTREAIKLMTKDGAGGQIINISSLCDRDIPKDSADMHFFCSTQAMVSTITKCLQLEVPPKIRVSSICPGLVKTDFVKTCWGSEMEETVYTANNYLTPKDVAEAVVYILKSPPYLEASEIRIQALKKRTS